MTIAVTGATGFLGTALVRRLLEIEKGQQVRVLARNPDKARQLFGSDVEIIAGDITDQAQVQRTVHNASYVYHLAGQLYHPIYPVHSYTHTHVEGTRTLLAACQKEKALQRLLYCSTTGVFGITGHQPATEEAPYAPTNPYETAKVACELLVGQAHRTRHLPVSIIRPGLVYGPGDLHLLGLFQAIKKRLFHVIDGGRAMLHPIYITDMINAFLLGAHQDQAVGRSYNIAGSQPVSIYELAQTIAQAQNLVLPRSSIPLWLAHLVATASTLTPGMRASTHAPLTHSRIDFLTHSRIYNTTRAQHELEFVPSITLEAGIRQTVNWYQAHAYL
ncbi:NAD-dependent epimerase/dehydratase family protein [Dictyobacter formicarum]|uniref:NAD-dependent epimerase n=1 Tax=Dictyobacter formicarum TaxID=2778368 RepID=A0ABQ3VSS4_9CHLR|nr:NAD-dependent epimerase/dehydratase family protein [Dictyobacter formicarum]GHO89000.1 NAD-dependent epimerase [Dictyobacter formicarum]